MLLIISFQFLNLKLPGGNCHMVLERPVCIPNYSIMIPSVIQDYTRKHDGQSYTPRPVVLQHDMIIFQ